MNLYYCWSCGYDVDHPGGQCREPREGHIPNVPRDEAHTVWRASMKAQHKTLPDGTGAGKGWILANQLGKANFVIKQQKQWREKQQQQQPWNGQQQWGHS